MASSGHVSTDDLTAKARIRNAALELYADAGEDATSMRAVAAAAGVTVGLIVHHFQTKDGLREAIERHIVDLFADAIAQAPSAGGARAVTKARDASVASMLREYPAVVGYLRRALLDTPGRGGRMVEKLAELSAEQVASLRAAGLASTDPSTTSQVIGVLVRQLGHLFLQPMIDGVWSQLAGDDAPEEQKPQLVIRVVEPDAPGVADGSNCQAGR